MFGFIIYMDVQQAKKSTVLYFSSEKECELRSQKVEEGLIKFGKKVFMVDSEEPTLLKNQGTLLKSFRPMHVIKWNSALPLSFEKDGIKVISGENLKSLLEGKTLQKLLEPKGKDTLMLLYLVLGIIVGAIAGYGIPFALKANGAG